MQNPTEEICWMSTWDVNKTQVSFMAHIFTQEELKMLFMFTSIRESIKPDSVAVTKIIMSKFSVLNKIMNN